MLPFKEHVYVEDMPKTGEIVFACDIGGTNSNFSVCHIEDGKVTLLLSIHIKSRKITEFAPVVHDVVKYIKDTHNISLEKACFAVAGIVSADNDYSKPTNLDFVIDAKEITKVTPLTKVVLINDFEAVGYGYNEINPQELVEIQKGKSRAYGNKIIVGAGTGLGKTILYWDDHHKRYIPMPSEGGHADFAAQHQKDIDLILFIRKILDTSTNVSWEHVLSGRGIQHIYKFLESSGQYKQTEYTQKIAQEGYHPDQIFAYCKEEAMCSETMDLFTQYYARCAKDFTLDALALGGVYIAGGIADKNVDMFSRPIFKKEFYNSSNFINLLKAVPIFIITDYNVSLYGSAVYVMLYF